MTGYMNKSKTDCWGTPDHIKNKYKNYFDPCPYPFENDGLEIDWLEYKHIFVNPPYSNIYLWAKKCYDTLSQAKEKNIDIEIHLLIPARTDTIYFHDYIYNKSEIEFIKGRLKFKDLTNVAKKVTSAPFASMICKFVNNKILSSYTTIPCN